MLNLCVKKCTIISPFHRSQEGWLRGSGVLTRVEVCTKPHSTQIKVRYGVMCGIWKRDFDSGEQRCNCCTAVFEIAVRTPVFQVENRIFVRENLILARFLTKIRWIFEMLAKLLIFFVQQKGQLILTWRKYLETRFSRLFWLKIRKILKTTVYRSFYCCKCGIPLYRCFKTDVRYLKMSCSKNTPVLVWCAVLFCTNFHSGVQ